MSNLHTHILQKYNIMKTQMFYYSISSNQLIENSANNFGLVVLLCTFATLQINKIIVLPYTRVCLFEYIQKDWEIIEEMVKMHSPI